MDNVYSAITVAKLLQESTGVFGSTEWFQAAANPLTELAEYTCKVNQTQMLIHSPEK